jgi:hypothetical protein
MHDVEIEGTKLAAGSYGFHLLPEEHHWTLLLRIQFFGKHFTKKVVKMNSA